MRFLLKISFPIFILLTILVHTLEAQTREFYYIEGTIKDQSTREPLIGVNVFLNNTTLGSATDSEGKYTIKKIPVGKYELVISMVGYEVKKKTLTIENRNMTGLDYNLIPVSIELGQVDVTAEKDDDWEDQYELFAKYFIGTSENAEECSILNKEIIDFRLSGDQLTLIASAGERLILVNEALGYNVFINLKDFRLSRYGETEYLAEAYFQEMETTDPVIQYKWDQNRKRAYLGSTRHFLASLTRQELFDEGFRVYNTGYPAWRQLTKFNYIRPWLEDKIDTVSEWERSINHDEYVKVVYANEPEENNYLYYRKQQGSKLNAAQNIQTSWFKLPFGYVFFDTSGNIVNEMINMKLFGYWSWHRMADFLPRDYTFTEE